MYKQEDALGDQLKTARGLKEVQEGTLNAAEKQLNQSKKNLEIFKDQKEAAKVTKAVLTDPKQLKLQEALSQAIVKQQDVQMKLGQNKEKLIDLTAQEKKLAGDLNRLKGRGFDRENKSFRNTADQLSLVRRQITNTTKAIEGGVSKSGKTVVTGLNNDLIEAAKLIDKADKELQAFKTTAAKPVQGGFLQQIQTGFKGLGAKGAMGSMGKGALGAAALIPGAAPFALGAGIGQANKTGGQAIAGGMMGAVGAGAIMGTVALVEFARASAEVAAEMDRMRIALAGVVPDQESYNTAIEKVEKLSSKYGISQKLIVKQFTQLQASADAAGFSVEETGTLMEGLITKTLASGKGIEELKGVMLAAGQILSKGKLQAEEARGQIGERIPGFMADLANSMKISMKVLDKEMEQGRVTLEDFFKLGEDLLKNNEQTALRLAESYANAGMRMSTAVENLQASFGKLSMILGAKFQNNATGMLKAITNIVDKVNSLTIALIKAELAFDSFLKESLFRGAITNFKIPLKGGTNLGLTDKERRDKEQELSILTGDQTVKTRDNKAIKEKNELLEQQAANWKNIEQRLRIDLKFQQDRIKLGEEEAEIQRRLAEIKLQFPNKEEADFKVLEDLIRDTEKAAKAADEASTAYDDWLDGINKRLKELEDPMYRLTTLVDAASDSFRDSFKEMVKGTKSVGDAFVDMFNRIADAYLDMVAETIAAQASKGIGSFFMNLGLNALSGGFGSALSGSTLATNVGDVSWKTAVNAPSMGYASGGYVDRPTNAVIGDAGPEYVLREDQMAGALARYASGQRGQSVIPIAGSSSSGGIGGGGNVTVSYTGPTLNFNGDEYVPKSSVPEIINAAARQGAKAGEAKMMSNLRNSRSTRASVGL